MNLNYLVTDDYIAFLLTFVLPANSIQLTEYLRNRVSQLRRLVIKHWTVAVILFSIVAMLSSFPTCFPDFQKDISIQAGQYQHSPEHQAIKALRHSLTYAVGDTRTFWRWNLAVMPPSWVQTAATCRGVGEHSYVFVADSEWQR